MRDAASSVAAVFDPALIVFGGCLGGAMVRALGRLPPETNCYSNDIRPAALYDEAAIGLGQMSVQSDAIERLTGRSPPTLPISSRHTL